MENLSAEVGHKMRSAVKAKLIEMGTGGTAGYIDDELPDYVMIMVANKRSKQQMTDDLTLFLGDNTPQFVDWLYLVLQKLQEVAIPAAAAASVALAAQPPALGGATATSSSSTKAGKSSATSASASSSSASKSSHSDSKSGRTNKSATTLSVSTSSHSKSSTSTGSSSGRTSGSSRHTSAAATIAAPDDGAHTPPPLPAGASITDVFAEHLMQKARSTLAAEKAASNRTKCEDQFDIPTMSEIAAAPLSRRKEIAALADLQKKINAAKRQLGQVAGGGGGGDSEEDEDFINLNDLEEEMGDEHGAAGGVSPADGKSLKSGAASSAAQKTQRVPITFREEPAAKAAPSTAAEDRSRKSSATAGSTSAPKQSASSGRSSVLDRLGVRSQPDKPSSGTSSAATVSVASRVSQPSNSTSTSSSTDGHHRRGQQEIYVPSFRRTSAPNERNSDRDRNPERSATGRPSDDRHAVDRHAADRDRRPDRTDRERERDRERDLLRSRNPDRDGPSAGSTGRDSRSSAADRSRERSSSGHGVRDRLGAAVSNSHASASAGSNSSHARSHAANANNPRDLRDRMRDRSSLRSAVAREKPAQHAATSASATSSAKTIESKVHVAPGRSQFAEPAALALQSAIAGGKPKRSQVAPAARQPQACKSLLLRAMAEAQKSTALVKPHRQPPAKEPGLQGPTIDLVGGGGGDSRAALYTKRFRNKSNIVIQVERGGTPPMATSEDDEDAANSEVEYIVETIEYAEIADDSEEERQQQLQHRQRLQMQLQQVDQEEEEEGAEGEEGEDGEVEEYDDMIHEASDDERERDDTTATEPEAAGDEAESSDDMIDADTIATATSSTANSSRQSTQFVVTLDDLKNNKYAMRTKAELLRGSRNGGGGGTPDRDGSRRSTSRQSNSNRVNKLIVQNDTEDEEELRKEVERSNVGGGVPKKVKPAIKATGESASQESSGSDELMADGDAVAGENAAESAAAAPANGDKEATAAERADGKEERRKRRRLSPITFDRDGSPKRTRGGAERRGAEDAAAEPSGEPGAVSERVSRKYDNVPALPSSLGADQPKLGGLGGGGDLHRSKELCKYYPACGRGDSCEFSHPIACKQFPNCKFGDQCMYFHPRCKYDLTCTKPNCYFSHSLGTTSAAAPLSSHVVPVSNYKSITNTPLPVLCRFHPKCNNDQCSFYHPKLCRFGRNCVNRADCVFWHGSAASATSAASVLASSSVLGGGGGGGGSGGGADGGGKDKLKWFASSTVY